MPKKHKTRIYIDASPMTGKVSGIGHNTLELSKALKALIDSKDAPYEVYLFLPFDKTKDLAGLGLSGFKRKTIPIPMVIYNQLWKFKLLPPLDIFLGKGVYIFPNFRNTPLLCSKNITFVHDASFMRYPDFTSPKNLKFLTSNIVSWCSRADIIATLSVSSKNDLQEYLNINADKIYVVPCGVDASIFFKRATAEIDSIKHKYGIEGDYIFYLGNIEPRKNIVALLDGFEIITKKYPHLGLVIVGGDSWLSQQIDEKINYLLGKGLRIVRPSRYVADADLPALFSGALALVHPAVYEGFGISPLQALSCGTPVVVGHNSSIPEVVGDVGIYVDVKSAKEISSAIEEVIVNKAVKERARLEGPVRARKFTWSSSAERLLHAINQIENV